MAIYILISIAFLPKNENRYIKAIRSAHLAHHRPKTKTDFHNYGLLIYSSKFFKDLTIN